MITPDIDDFYKTSNESERDKDRRGDQQHRFTFGRAKTPTKVDEPDCDLTAIEAHRGAPPRSANTKRESVEDELRQQLKQM